jgi:glycosyltransferase involved in cell wall biosynthesis
LTIPSYVVVSPVKDEDRYVEQTLRSMAAQTVRPAAWVIVDDGSSDHTADIIRQWANRTPFIRLVQHPHSGRRQPGSAVIRAFSYGYALLADQPHDIVVKLDCDLSFEADYFEKLLGRFAEDPTLGIASGVYLEEDGAGSWKPVPMPAYHAFGASKVVRRKCYADIGGFVTAAGWDTVDEIRALARGWRTGHFADLGVRHHKREGTGIGQLRTSRMHGEIYYLTGGDPLFFAFKVLHRLAERPLFLNAAALSYGYFSAAVVRRPRLVTHSEARAYRRLLRQRLLRLGHGAAELKPLQSDR